MCYSGKCLYEDYMGDCTLPISNTKHCNYGHKGYKKADIVWKIKQPIYLIKHLIKYATSKKYRNKFKKLPF